METNVVFLSDYWRLAATKRVCRFEGPGTRAGQNSGDSSRSVFEVKEKPRLRGKKSARSHPPAAETVGEAAKRVIAELEKRAAAVSEAQPRRAPGAERMGRTSGK